ncbi:MAG: hypothetical protein L6Q98_07465 [Anaerolineae bacterium]|nr:hypothetical protein [Anaerolineae bacterium]NUQ04657.1 hypothetical protein [Anaerolineae bacterium]
MMRRLLTGIALGYCLFVVALILLRLLHVTNPVALALLISLTMFFLIPAPLALALAIMARSRVAQVSVAVVCLVALAWLGDAFLVMPTLRASGEPLRLLIFNASGKTAVRADAELWLHTQPADVVLIQETFYAPPGPGIEALREPYPYQALQATELNYRGNATLSVHPIEAEGQEGFKPDSVYTRVVITFQDQPIALYNVSLQAPIGVGASNTLASLFANYDTVVRDEQIAALMERLSQETLPMIVAGEFNVMEFEPAYDQFAAFLGDSFREAGSGLGFTFPAGGGYAQGFLRPVLRLDYIWHDQHFRAISAEVLPPVSIADRLPVRVELQYVGESES